MEHEEKVILQKLLADIDDDEDIHLDLLPKEAPVIEQTDETSDNIVIPQVEEKEPINEMLMVRMLEKASRCAKKKQFKKDKGLLTCIDVSSKYIAVGTSLGYVILFDHFQEVQFVLGKGEAAENGRVYSISLSSDSEWILVGHQSGMINVWSIDNQKKIKNFQNESKLPVVFVSFLDDKKSKFICCSLDSVVLLYSLSKVLGMFLSDVHIVMTKTMERGNILAVSPLKPDPRNLHPIIQASLVACGTYSHIMILSVQEVSHIMYQLKKPAKTASNCLPYFSWRPLISNEKEEGRYKLYDPVLAIAWGNNINLVLVTASKNDDTKLKFKIVTAYKCDDQINGITWVDPTSIVYMTANRGLVLFDPFKAEEIESTKLSIELACHNKFTFASNEMIQSYHNSMCCYQEHVYTLSWNEIHSAHLLSWEERVDNLVERRMYIEAIGLLISFIQGKMLSGVKLPRNQLKANTVLHMKMEEVLVSFVKSSLQVSRLALTQSAKESGDVAIIAIDCCFNIGRSDFIFNGLYPIFKQYNKEGLIFENIIPFIVGGKVSKLKPEIIQQIFMYYEVNDPSKINELIKYLDISQIDFHIIVKICIKHLLSDTLFHVYIAALEDYISPFEILIDIFIEADKPTDSDNYKARKRALGKNLLEYMEMIFNEIDFVSGSPMQRDKAASLRDEMLNCILGKGNNGRMSCLLKEECETFLTTLTIAFDKMPSSSPLLQRWLNVMTNLIFEHPKKMILNQNIPPVLTANVFVFILKYVFIKGLKTELTIDFKLILSKLEPYPQLQYEFFNIYLDYKVDKSYVLSPDLGEKMLDLMCQFEPFKVLPWIQKYDASYKMENAIKITSKYEATITTYCKLLERTGDIGKALDAILALIWKKIGKLKSHIPKVDMEYISAYKEISFPNSELNSMISNVSKLLSSCFYLCKRNNDKLNPKEKDEMWMRILESILKPVHIIETQLTEHQISFEIPKELESFGKDLSRPQLMLLKENFHKLLGYVIDNALTYVSADFILDRVTKQGKTYLRDFKTILNLLIDDFKYENIVLHEVNHLIKEDAHKTMEALIKKKRMRVPPSKIQL